jgi:hypothetical protein
MLIVTQIIYFLNILFVVSCGSVLCLTEHSWCHLKLTTVCAKVYLALQECSDCVGTERLAKLYEIFAPWRMLSHSRRCCEASS